MHPLSPLSTSAAVVGPHWGVHALELTGTACCGRAAPLVGSARGGCLTNRAVVALPIEAACTPCIRVVLLKRQDRGIVHGCLSAVVGPRFGAVCTRKTNPDLLWSGLTFGAVCTRLGFRPYRRGITHFPAVVGLRFGAVCTRNTFPTCCGRASPLVRSARGWNSTLPCVMWSWHDLRHGRCCGTQREKIEREI